ncbi:hypothetical protein JFV29_12430 [Peribacillus sp. TH16]|uniref:hypothetical protein n=1 Tax=Peribacillus sp. TH16 TaxID=2798482 RepID=UPI001911FA06|nr:hypothetical protein [Peribacillus sp. TH16]MBK5482689.1 hypothetical protein [Peribacillus sp. TH16]
MKRNISKKSRRGPITKYPIVIAKIEESPHVTTEIKKCSHCGIFHSLTHFHKNKSHSHGLYTACRYCVSKQRRESYKQYNKTREKKIRKEEKTWQEQQTQERSELD